MERQEKAALCMLHSIKGIGNRSLIKIKHDFNSYTEFLQLDASQLRTRALLPPLVLEEVLILRKRFQPMPFLEELEGRDIRIMTLEEDSYPRSLRNISNPPAVLYCRGSLEDAGNFSLAVVGCRAATRYGKHTARELARSLADCGVNVVSGMARGIDREAHLGALEGNGFTVAVLGSGMDVVYPREHIQLYEQICREGLVISEFPPSVPPEPRNFPMRNRIISGLAQGVIVVEARMKSGALITADFALEQGKDVFAVPGPINSMASAGTNNLIKQGAIVYTEIMDIIQEYQVLEDIFPAPGVKQEELLLLDKEESVIMESMSYDPCHFDKLLTITGFDIGQLSSLLLNLELGGIVQSLPGNYYVKL